MAFISQTNKLAFLTCLEQNSTYYITINKFTPMSSSLTLGNSIPDSTRQPGTHRALGAYLESLRLTRKVENRLLSVKRLARLAQMGTSTYEKVKRA